MAVLFDLLNHPNADLGESLPSSLNWRFDQSKAVSHVVIGSDEIGGSWSSLQDSKILTLSHKEWLDLPIYGYREWEEGRVDQDFPVPTSKTQHPSLKRTTVSNVCDYYKDYVKELNLDHSMVSNACVTSVRPATTSKQGSTPTPAKETQSTDVSCNEFCSLSGPPFSWADIEEEFFLRLEKEGSLESTYTDSEVSSGQSTPSEPLSPVDLKEQEETCPSHPRWCVEGYKKQQDGAPVLFTVQAKYIVLACGVSNRPNHLDVPGEDLQFVMHDLKNISPLLDSLKDPVQPVLVVGAGLSAADVIILAMSKGIPVYHVFHRDPRDPKLIFSKLAPSVYPEYQKVFSLMKGESTSPLYTPFPLHIVQSFGEDGSCVLYSKMNKDDTTTVKISRAIVLIGSTADLSFLPSGLPPLGADEFEGISPKKNPMEIDPFSFESIVQDSMFGMGPLVGDNFVRFALGGSLAITSKLWKDRMANPVR